MKKPAPPKATALATYRVAVPHLSIDEYLIKAESAEGAIKLWRDTEPPLEPHRTHTPFPGPRPRAELVPAPSSDLVLPPESQLLVCGVCGDGRLLPGTAKGGRPVMICQACGAVGVGTLPARA